jgi:hypothetical protein
MHDGVGQILFYGHPLRPGLVLDHGLLMPPRPA